MARNNDTFDPERLLGEARYLRSLALRLAGGRDWAADVEQDAWVAVLARPPRRAADRDSLRAFLGAVVRNLVRRRRRADSNRTLHERRAAKAEGLPPTDDVAERLDFQRRLVAAIAGLEEPHRTAVTLRLVEGLDHARAAERQGLKVPASRQRLSRALATLRARLDDDFGDRPSWTTAVFALTAAGTSPGPLPGLGSGLLGGGWMASKMAWALSVAVLLVAGTWWWRAEPGPPGVRGATPGTLELAPAETLSSVAVAREEGERRELASVPPELAAADPAPSVEMSEEPIDRERDLHGRVTDPDGRAIPGATVRVLRRSERDFSLLDLGLMGQPETPRHELATDGEGRFRVRLEPGRRFHLEVSGEPFATTTVTDCYAGERVEVTLHPAARVFGRVSDAAGEPASDVRLRFFRPGSSAGDQRVEADAQGRYTTRGLAPGSWTIDLASHAGASTGWKSVEVLAGEELELDFQLERGYAVEGHVRDARTGQPIVGARVAEGWTGRHFVLSDAYGHYEFPHFTRHGVYELHVFAAGYGKTSRSLYDPRSGTLPVGQLDFTLEPGDVLAGTVTDTAGRALRGVYVAAVASEHQDGLQHTDWRSDVTDEQGRFRLEDLRTDVQHTLLLKHEGYGSRVYGLARDVGSRELGTFVLRPGATLLGRLVDERGHPIAGFDVALEGRNADADVHAPMPGRLDYVTAREAETDDLGRFSFADLAEGDFTVSVRRPDGRSRVQVAVSLRGGEVRRGLELVLERGLSLSGRVVDPAGKGAEAILFLRRPGGEDVAVNVALAGGEFRFEGLAEESFELVARTVGRAEDSAGNPLGGATLRDLRPPAEGLELVLPRADRLRGRVTDTRGQAVVGAPLYAEDETGERVSTNSDDRGEFELNPPRGSRVTVVVQTEEREELARLEGLASDADDVILTVPARD